MKYYSTVLSKLFDSVEELTEAETSYQRRKEEKEANEKALKEARNKRLTELKEARKNYNKLLNDYMNDYDDVSGALVALWNLFEDN